MNQLINFYQTLPSFVSPEIIGIGNFSLRWYSLGYIIAIVLGIGLAKSLIKKKKLNFAIKTTDLDDFIIYLILGIFLGGRLFYAIFYNFSYFFSNPLEVFLPFRFGANGIQFIGISGLSFHGGLIGVLIAMYYFSRKKKISLPNFTDLIMTVGPLGYTFGRLGNFMNGELYGRVTEKPWGMYFLNPINGIPFEMLRHPSQLYEAFSEGVLLFLILWYLKNKKFPAGYITAFCIMGYGIFRFIIEFFREPDRIFKSDQNELGTVFLFFSMGQVLCFFMIVFGLWLIAKSKNNPPSFK